jgi:hypothetical protein
MKTVPLLRVALVLMLACGSAAADPARNPKRMLNGRIVDLSPLIKWWPKQHGDRPLAAWAHVTGKIVGTNALGWTVQGGVEESEKKADSADKASGSLRFVLKSPPRAELAEFERLHARLKSLQQERDGVNRGLASAEARQKEDAARRQELRAQGYRVRGTSRATRVAQEKSRIAKRDLQAIDAQIKAVDAAMRKLPNSGNAYQVDCFAMKTAQGFHGVPIYDHGYILH